MCDKREMEPEYQGFFYFWVLSILLRIRFCEIAYEARDQILQRQRWQALAKSAL